MAQRPPNRRVFTPIPSLRVCRLCRQSTDVVNSHIISEFLYKASYDNRHKAIQLKLGNTTEVWVQKGYRDRLLCRCCESFINEHFEKPFKRQWVDSGIVPTQVPSEPLTVTVEYASFKLFHLSVLWRASEATTFEFSNARLGPHADKIREMLIAKDPGQPDQYPIAGFLLHLDNEVESSSVISPWRFRVGEHWAYAIGYGACVWVVIVSDHFKGGSSPLILNSKGSLTLQLKSITSFRFLNDFMRNLRESRVL